MFEDSTFESTGRIRTRSRGWMIAAFVFNAAILLALILIPLFYPEALPRVVLSILMQAPPTPVEEPRPVVRPAVVQTQMPAGVLVAPTRIPREPYIPTTAEPPGNINVTNLAFGGPDGGPSGLPHGVATSPVVVHVQSASAHVSSGVMQGYLIRKVLPEYPAIGREIHMEGTVVLQATISKSGTIENLRVVSGPAMLQQAALDAVKQWRYKPYLLNGEPVEVETTVNVEFRLN